MLIKIFETNMKLFRIKISSNLKFYVGVDRDFTKGNTLSFALFSILADDKTCSSATEIPERLSFRSNDIIAR